MGRLRGFQDFFVGIRRKIDKSDILFPQITGRQLTPGQQDIVTQIKEFMDQSKSAIAAGDSERGHNLAEKAHLLSEDLLKP